MSQAHLILLIATITAALGCGLMLPRGGRWGRRLGMALAMVALGLFGSQMSFVGAWAEEVTFGVLAAVTVIAAGGAISCKSPVYCAIWFGLSLVGTAGLFLYQGAQFLGVATIVVYAGAILVMFLFVLMLAQPRGPDATDRLSWNGLASAAVGAVLVGLLTTVTIDQLGTGNENRIQPPVAANELATKGGQVLDPNHAARLGAELFGKHLLSVEIAGTLLLVALVGTVAIVAQGKTPAAGQGETHHG